MRCQVLPSFGWLAPIAVATAIASGSPPATPLPYQSEDVRDATRGCPGGGR
jgi:hypothetical protein